MNPQPIATPSHGLDLGDIYYILFRHKWKILLCSLAGLAVAASLYRSEAPPFQSEAKLLVRYIISESKSTGPNPGSSAARISPDERGATIMNTEVEILNSMDLANEVARAVGPEKILARVSGGKDIAEAASYVKTNLTVYVGQGSSVIHLSLKHPDPDLVPLILREVIDRYYKLHEKAHRADGVLGESLSAEADTLRSRLNQTEEELRRAINRTGTVAPELAKEAINNQMVSTRREILNLESELAARLAVLQELKKHQSSTGERSTTESRPGAPSEEIPASVQDDYRTQSALVSRLRAARQDLLLQFKSDSPRVQEYTANLNEAEAKVKALRDQYPDLARTALPVEGQTGPNPEAAEAVSTWMQITSHQAKIKELNSQMERLKQEANRLDQAEGDITELRRKKELQEQHFRYYAAALEQSRINQTLGDGKVSNITQIQNPSPPFRAQMNMKKVGMSAVIGVLAGFAWAFLIELYFDRSVRRPKDLQRLMRVPLFLSIPKLKSRQLALTFDVGNQKALPAGTDKPLNGTALASPSAPVPFARIDALQPFHETLRDRLIGFFESRNLTHKPKLVAVTGLRRSAGVTTTAAGLARSLSETGEGNVLLVDMTAEQGAAHQFAKGKAVCGLDELLETRTQAHVHENLYVVAENSGSERLTRSLPQRFSRIIPKLKASDFDYIIFDMPTVNQLSITPRLAGFMDMVLVVVESEKTDKEVVEGACALLAESKANVGIVLNKTKSYVPTGLQQQLAHS